MLLRHHCLPLLTAGLIALCSISCDSKSQKKDLAPESAELEAPKAASTSQAFEVDPKESKVSFDMGTRLERIVGKAPSSLEGSFYVNLSDIEKASGIVKVDLFKLSVYRRWRKTIKGEFSHERKSEMQNKRMRSRIGISAFVSQEEVKKNRYLEFKLTGAKSLSGKKSLLGLTGFARKLALEVTGELRLHGRVTTHTFPAEATVYFEDGKPLGLRLASTRPLTLNLEAHDIRPANALHALADKALEAITKKDVKLAMISVDLRATAR